MTDYDISRMKTQQIYENLQRQIKMIGSKAPIEAKKHAALWASRYAGELQSRDLSVLSLSDRLPQDTIKK